MTNAKLILIALTLASLAAQAMPGLPESARMGLGGLTMYLMGVLTRRPGDAPREPKGPPTLPSLLLLLALGGCDRSVEACDANVVQARMRAAYTDCQAQGYEWDACPERERHIRELTKELEQCSN